MKKSKKLMWRIFAFLIGFCAILLIILWIMEIMLLDKMYENIRKNEIKKAITLIEENIDNPDLNQIIIKLQDESEIIVTPAHSFIPPKRPNPNDRPPLRQAITETRNFITADGITRSFVFYAIISPVNATISTIKVQLYYVTGIMIFLSVILAFIIAKTVSKPIEELNNSAKLLANGDYSILNIEHNNHTEMRFSINTSLVINKYEHFTASRNKRIEASIKAVRAGYSVGFPITFEIISHRYTTTAKNRILQIFPESELPMDDEERKFKYGQFGYGKYLYEKEIINDIKEFFTKEIEELFQNKKLLYII